MGMSAIGFNLEIFRFLPNRYTKQKQNQCVQRSLHAMRHFMHVLYSHLDCTRCKNICTRQTAVILITRKKYLKTPNLNPCKDNDGAGFGISGVYLCSAFHVVDSSHQVNLTGLCILFVKGIFLELALKAYHTSSYKQLKGGT